MSEKNTHQSIIIKSYTKRKLDTCKKEFVNHHPEFKEIPISYNKIIQVLADYYIDS